MECIGVVEGMMTEPEFLVPVLFLVLVPMRNVTCGLLFLNPNVLRRVFLTTTTTTTTKL